MGEHGDAGRVHDAFPTERVRHLPALLGGRRPAVTDDLIDDTVLQAADLRLSLRRRASGGCWGGVRAVHVEEGPRAVPHHPRPRIVDGVPADLPHALEPPDRQAPDLPRNPHALLDAAPHHLLHAPRDGGEAGDDADGPLVARAGHLCRHPRPRPPGRAELQGNRPELQHPYARPWPGAPAATAEQQHHDLAGGHGHQRHAVPAAVRGVQI
mmetsp:Transcript_41139/g.97465  ORF Transcript_41139/g.97465 Transcript_41139/m.97465 type:complete len:211 (+) Transcript_41139:847-1479(+)